MNISSFRLLPLCLHTNITATFPLQDQYSPCSRSHRFTRPTAGRWCHELNKFQVFLLGSSQI